MARGWFNLACWNGLSEEQQLRLVSWGNLPMGYQPEGYCQNGAEVCIETQDDEAPGPRFYCYACGALYLAGRWKDSQTSPRSDLPQAIVHGNLET